MKINWGFGPPKDDGKDAGQNKGKGGQAAKATSKRPAAGKAKTSSNAGLLSRFGQRDAGRDEGRDGDGDAAAGSELHSWTSGANMTTKGVVGLLWVALVAGPAALALQVLTPSDPTVQASGDGERLGESAAVGEFAEQAVVAWLETPRDTGADRLSRYFGSLAQTRPEIPWTVSEPEVAEIQRDADGLWSVVVGVSATEGKRKGKPRAADATVDTAHANAATPPDDSENGDTGDEDEPSGDGSVERITSGRLYFRLPVLYVEGEMIAQGLPSPVSAPAGIEQLESAYVEPLTTDHPAFDKVSNFLGALLVTGDQAGLEAYSSPGTSFTALDPSPYADVQVAELTATTEDAGETPADGTTLDVRADVVLSGSNGSKISAQYFLLLRARENRWEVAEVLDAPVLAEPVPAPTAVPSSPGTLTGTPTQPPGTSSTGTDAATPSGSATLSSGSPSAKSTKDPEDEEAR